MTEVAVEKPLFDSLPGKIPNGVWTMSSDRGHRTIKVSTILNPESELHGRRKVSILTGPDNLFSYTGVAFLNTVDGKDEVKVWKRHEGTQLHKITLAWLDLLAARDDPAIAKKWEGYKIEEARNCLLCNHLLTNPESIERGIGPVCGKDENGA